LLRITVIAAGLLAVGACSLIADLGPEPNALAVAEPDGASDVPAADAQAFDADASAPTDDAAQTVIEGCRIYPSDNPWNRDVSNDPVDTNAMANVWPNMATSAPLHADIGTPADTNGLPFSVSATTPVPVVLPSDVGDSDLLPCPGDAGGTCYPIPSDAIIEANLNKHVLVLDTKGAPNDCTIYELFHAARAAAGPGWTADRAAIFPLGSNALHPDGWGPSTPSGLPIIVGLVRFQEATDGEITHAIRFTLKNTAKAYIHPATHGEGATSAGLPPMGQRVRLKAGFSVAPFSGPSLAIVKAMQRYGLILADVGSDWYISGDRNDGWTAYVDDVVTQLRAIHGSDFEIVASGPTLTTGL
jgi:hypothetical protein